jgi:transposase
MQFRMKPLTQDLTNVILNQLDHGKSARKIARDVGLSPSTVCKVRKSKRNSAPHPPSGRPALLSPHDKNHLLSLITTHTAISAADAAKILSSEKGKTVSADTVERALKEKGMKAVVKKKKPLLSKKNIKDRLSFAQTYEDYTVEDWKRVLWTDETKVNRFGSDGVKWSWVKSGRSGFDQNAVEKTVKHGGGNIMVWGSMMWGGPGKICLVEGRMNAIQYCSILEKHLYPSCQEYLPNSNQVIFQQDNDPKHTSKLVKSWLSSQAIQVLKWPGQSPDLNPIEHLWTHVKREMGKYKTQPKGVVELWERFQEVWKEIDPQICHNLVESLPRRIQAVLVAKGRLTKY